MKTVWISDSQWWHRCCVVKCESVRSVVSGESAFEVVFYSWLQVRLDNCASRLRRIFDTQHVCARLSDIVCVRGFLVH